MPSFLFVELSSHYARNLHHRPHELILTPTCHLPRPFEIRHDLTV